MCGRAVDGAGVRVPGRARRMWAGRSAVRGVRVESWGVVEVAGLRSRDVRDGRLARADERLSARDVRGEVRPVPTAYGHRPR
jgi:hypothetical protein